jgi:hypothetical protein
MFETFRVTYALMKISVEAGCPEFGIYFPNQIKRSAIKQAKKSNLGSHESPHFRGDSYWPNFIVNYGAGQSRLSETWP